MNADQTSAPGRCAASALGRLLPLAAAPSFAAMGVFALLDRHGMAGGFCTATPGGPQLTEMVAMYGLMSLFHLPPWLKFISTHQP